MSIGSRLSELRRRIRNWWRQKRAARLRRRRAAIAKSNNFPLREFVYLDEVSILSLIGSRLGPVVSEITDSLANTLSSEVSGSVGANVGAAKADVKSRLAMSETRGSQVLRKSSIQTTFKELYDYEKAAGNLVAAPDTMLQPPIVPHPKNSVKDANFGNWSIDPTQLVRGTMIEFEVELEADAAFKMSAVLSAVVGLAESNKQLAAAFQNHGEAAAINRVLDELLVGLVPVKGLVADYRIHTNDTDAYLVNRRIFEQWSEEERQSLLPLYIVGVTEQALYWKDLRRILFSGAKYSVLGRLSKHGLQDKWAPVKLGEVLKLVAPGLMDQVDAMAQGVLALGDAPKTHKEIQGHLELVDAVVDFGLSLAKNGGHEISEMEIRRQLTDAGVLEVIATLDNGIEDVREVFRAAARTIDATSSVDAEEISDMRRAALARRGLQPDGTLADRPTQTVTAARKSSEWLLEAEIVAIYW